MIKYDNELLNLYEKLLIIWKENISLLKRKDYTICPYIIGNKYDKEENKLLVVGRAINSWSDCNNDIIKINQFFNNESLDWVTEHEYCGKLNIPSYTRYKFWQLIKKVMNEKLYFDCNGDWANKIVWSNLYKLAPLKGGNPNEKICDKQLEICDQILAKEIELIKPKYILFIADTYTTENNKGHYWYQKENGEYYFNKTHDYIVNNKILSFNSIRPEFKKLEPLVDKVNFII